MILRRFLRTTFALAMTSFAGVACLQDFDTFVGTKTTDASPDVVTTPPSGTDAATVDAGRDASPDGAADAGDGGPCRSAPQSCLDARTTCRTGCDTTQNTCENACTNTGCRIQCNLEQNRCRGRCNDTCETCAGPCDRGCR